MLAMKHQFVSSLLLFAAKGILFLALFFVLVSGLGAMVEFDEGISDGQCNIAVLPLEGMVLPYHGLVDVPLVVTPELVEDFVRVAEQDDQIDALLLEINSPGGTPVASERIAERLRSSTLPTVGLIGDQGASGGYLIAASTDYLLASAMSDVGSIGVDMSFVEESSRNEQEGLTYVQLTTGQFKDIGNPNRPVTEEERALLQADLELVHQHFIDLVSEYRRIDRDEVEALADGATMPGVRAVSAGLIDAIGGRQEARSALATLLNIDLGAVRFCEYEAPLLPF
jgi:protease-4